MKVFLKIIFILLLILTTFSIFAYYLSYRSKFKPINNNFGSSVEKFFEERRLKEKILPLKKFIALKKYNSKMCFIIDMQISSGKNRFFVYDITNDSIIAAGLVAHGSCDNGFQFTAHFSNNVNSGCSCIGKFKIGESYMGRFGLSYKLYGLDSSNSNTFNRSIVLHSYECVPEKETYPLPLCNSRGCPMVSGAFLQKLKSYISNSERPILLEIID